MSDLVSNTWYRVSHLSDIEERIHLCIDGRYITVFRCNNSALHAIDSICSHAGGTLTGPLRDIEDIGVTAVSCPLHNYLFSINTGEKVFQNIAFDDKGRPLPDSVQWRLGKVVQRPHEVRVYQDWVYLKVNRDDVPIASDMSASSEICGRRLILHHFPIVMISESEMAALVSAL
jgi:nitrite reductase/ring-hydroxylating ferredoxin subunit